MRCCTTDCTDLDVGRDFSSACVLVCSGCFRVSGLVFAPFLILCLLPASWSMLTLGPLHDKVWDFHSISYTFADFVQALLFATTLQMSSTLELLCCLERACLRLVDRRHISIALFLGLEKQIASAGHADCAHSYCA
jgi:hypothetical protein